MLAILCFCGYMTWSSTKPKGVEHFFDNDVQSLEKITVFNARINGISCIEIKPEYYEYVMNYFKGYEFTPHYNSKVVDEDWSYTYVIKSRSGEKTITFTDIYCVIDGI